MDLGLSGKVAFIAGSSRGIGLEIARAFLREGASVAITGRDQDALDKASQSLSSEASPSRVLAISGDLTDPATIKSSLDRCVAVFGRVDAVVANVGSGGARAGWELEPGDWDASLNQNLLGSMNLATVALKHFVTTGNRSGSLTFVSSIAGHEAVNAPVAYSAAKAGLISAMKSLSRLAGAENIRVNTIAPGNILFPGGSWERKLKERRDFFEQYVQAEVPLKRFGTPDEVAGAVVFMASERASFITGACL